MIGLGAIPGEDVSSSAFDVSADGSTIVGYLTHSEPRRREAFRWTSDEGMIVLGDLPGGGTGSEARGVSDDGSVIVGYSMGVSGHEAFRWTREEGMIGLGSLLDGTIVSDAYGVSGDGSTIVGFRIVEGRQEAFRWTSGNGMVGLGLYGGQNTYAHDVSFDGAIAVGTSGVAAFYWTEEHGIVSIGELPGGRPKGGALGVSADGSTIVGYGHTGKTSSGYEPFIWDATNGMRELDDVLLDLGLDITGWELYKAWGISANGRVIVGTGINPSGDTEGWIAVLRGPNATDIDIVPGSDINPINPMSRGVIPVALLGSDTFNVAVVDVTTLAFGPEGAPILHRRDVHFRDVNGDGFTDAVSHYRTHKSGIVQGDVEACVSGETFDGTEFEGCDSILVLGICGLGFELALLLPGVMWLRQRRRSN